IAASRSSNSLKPKSVAVAVVACRGCCPFIHHLYIIHMVIGPLFVSVVRSRGHPHIAPPWGVSHSRGSAGVVQLEGRAPCRTSHTRLGDDDGRAALHRSPPAPSVSCAV